MGGSEDPCTSSFGCGNETSLDISSCCGSYQNSQDSLNSERHHVSAAPVLNISAPGNHHHQQFHPGVIIPVITTSQDSSMSSPQPNTSKQEETAIAIRSIPDSWKKIDSKSHFLKKQIDVSYNNSQKRPNLYKFSSRVSPLRSKPVVKTETRVVRYVR